MRVIAAAFVLAITACGGSSSETPWPVEPIDTDPGPAGEDLRRGNVLDVKKLPNTYPSGDGGASDDDGAGGEAP